MLCIFLKGFFSMEFSKRKICENNMNKKLSMYKKTQTNTVFAHFGILFGNSSNLYSVPRIFEFRRTGQLELKLLYRNHCIV